MILDPRAFAAPVPFPRVVLVVAHEFSLLRMHRDHWVAGKHVVRRVAVDVLEMRVTVEMVVAVLRLAVALKSVIQFLQRGPYPPMARRVTHGCSPAAKLRMLLQVQRRGDTGSLHDYGSTSGCSSSPTVGSSALAFLRPSPGRRILPRLSAC
jgi:hypothetical protein